MGSTAPKMHVDELEVPVELVARLVAEQFPQYAGLELERVRSGGTVNAIFRLGDALSVRLPIREEWTGGVEKDATWLPVLAPRLPVAVPTPVGVGRPAHGYPCTWGVYPWLEGELAERLADPVAAARDLARFLVALQRVDSSEAPPPTSRGIPLSTRDEDTRAAVAALGAAVDAAVVTEAWERALGAPAWDRPPLWIHGDLMAGNVLVDGVGRVRAVLDWSSACVGDPATDVMAAWTILPAEARAVFRDEVGVDGATWERGRGWALSWALIALPYYIETNPVITRHAWKALAEVLADHD